VTADEDVIRELTSLGVATIYEASGRRGLIDLDLIQIIAGSRAAGPARTAVCGQDDNRAVHATMARLQPGEILVLTMPKPAPVALVGELLATQAKVHGASGLLIDAAVRDVEDLRSLGLPVWCRWVRATGATKTQRGELDAVVNIGGTQIAPGDIVVLDADGAVVVEQRSVDDVLRASRARQEKESLNRRRFEAGDLSYDMYGMGAEDEAHIAAEMSGR
jgi:4-hydroxy-4-methyl-2-oxoglutarate aldolase